MQLSRCPNILFFGASNTIHISGENKKGRVQHNGEIMSKFKVEKSKLQSWGGSVDLSDYCERVQCLFEDVLI